MGGGAGSRDGRKGLWRAPLVISLPYRETLPSSSQAGFTMIVAGCNQPIADAFAAHKNFWLNALPARNLGVDGFDVQPGTLPVAERADWQQIAPTTIVHDAGSPRFATDDVAVPARQADP
jgi:hypothetical protein